MTAETKLSPRERILRATMRLLAEGGRAAVTTRAVGNEAGVQSPTIYRQFGDMQGLLDEVAGYGFSRYLEAKTTRVGVEDPVEDLRRGWDLHVDFGLANPALYALMYGDPRPGGASAGALEAQEILHRLVQRVAEAGRLRVSVEDAAAMIEAAGVGVVLSLIAAEDEDRDLSLSDTTREAILAAVTTDATPEEAGHDQVSVRSVALKAVLPEAPAGFTSPERALLSEWLDRLTHRPG